MKIIGCKIIVTDLDGTIADLEHRRHWISSKPKNYDAFYTGLSFDQHYHDIGDLIRLLHSANCSIIVCSGRPERTDKFDCKAATEKWLVEHNVPYSAIYMRKYKDYRKDSIVKVELLQDIIRDWGKPDIWLDDRNQVVDAIRAQGIRVLQVAPGNF